MDDFLVGIYVDQIRDQIAEAEKAYVLVLANSRNAKEVFSAIHHFIVHVSNIVKLLQPNIKSDNDFRKYRRLSILKKFPNIPEIDPKDIVIRDHFEHFDERIDYWAINSKSHNYADKNISDVDLSKALPFMDPKDSFRWFDYKAMVLYFCGDMYDLNSLHSYLLRVKNVL